MAIASKPKRQQLSPVTEDAALNFIEGATSKSQTRPKRKRASTMLRWDPELLNRVDAAAARRYQTRTAYITSAVLAALESEDQ